jgi:hypothetical protein
MSEREQLLAQLRDIHLPADVPASATTGPLAAIVIVLAIVAAF